MAHLPKYLLAAGFGFLVAQAQMADVAAGHWAERAVRDLLEKGILTGYPDGTFKGTQVVNRYQAAVMLYRAYLTWTEEVLSRVRRTLEEANLTPERIAEALSELASLREATGEIQQALEEFGVRLSTLEADLGEVQAALSAAMDAAGQVAALTDRQKALQEALARADAAYKEQLSRLNALEGRLQMVEKALADLTAELRSAEDARLKDAQVVGKRLYAVEERTSQLEKAVQARPQGEVYVGTGEGGPFGGLALTYGTAQVRLGTDRVEASFQGEGFSLAYRDLAGRREAVARYGLFQGIRLLGEVGAAEGRYYFATTYVEHERQGGLLPGVYARLAAGAGLVEGELGRAFLEAQAGLSVGPVNLTLGYARYWGFGGADTPLSALFGAVAYGPAEAYVAYAVPHEDIGRDAAFQVEGRAKFGLSPYRISVAAGYRDGLAGYGVASHVDRFRFTTATGFYGRVEVGYEVRF